MNISKLGEFKLIDRIARQVRTDSRVARGIGDDCAVLAYTKDAYLLFTGDMIVEGVDFLSSADPELVGRKALAVSLSDIASCAGTPQHALVTLGLPPASSVALVDGLYRGITRLARDFSVNIVGGDISRTRALSIDISMIGVVRKKHLVLRSGASPGDVIFVTGALGGSLRGRHFSFTPRVKEAQMLVSHTKVTSMIDISDGLLQDLGHIMRSSGVGAVLYEDQIPVDPGCRSLREALCGGEDFELLFTVPARYARKLGTLRTAIIPIGQIVPKRYGLKMLDTFGTYRRLRPCGYKHF